MRRAEIWDCLLHIWVAMCSESRDRQEFDRIDFLLYSRARMCVCVCVCGDDFY